MRVHLISRGRLFRHRETSHWASPFERNHASSGWVQ